MIAPPQPANESERLRALHSYDILDTLPEPAFEDLVLLASQICGAPLAFISLVDEDRQWFKAKLGLEISQAPRELAFCAHAILQPEEMMIVPDARRDERFHDNPFVTDGGVQFYAGAPLVTSSGVAIGTLCVADHTPRELSLSQKHALEALSRQTMAQIELRLTVRTLENMQSELKEALRVLETQSRTDSLTGIPNRRAFDERWKGENARASRYQVPVSVLMLDIDNFKGYNDSFGHSAGDELLRAFARLLTQKLRPSDFPARFGGEEFVVILPNTEAHGAHILAERLRAYVEETEWQFRQVTVSIGVATSPPCDLSGDELIETADKALYEAKRSGRNRVVVG